MVTKNPPQCASGSCNTLDGSSCASWCALSYVWMMLFAVVSVTILVVVAVTWIYPMNASFVVGRYMCPKNARIISVERLQPFEPHYQPYNAYELLKLSHNLGNESCIPDDEHILGRPDAHIRVLRIRHAIISGWQPLCAFVRLPELPDTLIVCWNNFRALTLFRYMIQSGMSCPKELEETGNIPNDAKYRTGVWSLYASVRDSVLQAFGDHKTRKLVICGHSLGGVLGTALAADLSAHDLQPSKSIWLYTYGSPRCANRAFCRWLQRHLVYCAHVQLERDVCYHLPQADILAPSVDDNSGYESYENVGQKLEFKHEDRGWQQNHSINTYVHVLENQCQGVTGELISQRPPPQLH